MVVLEKTGAVIVIESPARMVRRQPDVGVYVVVCGDKVRVAIAVRGQVWLPAVTVQRTMIPCLPATLLPVSVSLSSYLCQRVLPDPVDKNVEADHCSAPETIIEWWMCVTGHRQQVVTSTGQASRDL
eukprot:SAG11_NODE_926_length_6520_cov_6.586357_4_plen_127_part_00